MIGLVPLSVHTRSPSLELVTNRQAHQQLVWRFSALLKNGHSSPASSPCKAITLSLLQSHYRKFNFDEKFNPVVSSFR